MKKKSFYSASLLVIVTLIYFHPLHTSAEIICDKFNVVVVIHESSLDFSLDTDLPNNTVLTVTVSRSYFEKGNSAEYSVDYFNEKSIVGRWRATKRISLDNERWMSSLRKKQKDMSRLGLGFEVAKISDKITVRMIVSINQPDSRFGKDNAKLSGKAVKTKFFRIVEDELKIDYPLKESLTRVGAIPSLDPRKLEVGRTYKLSGKTPLMPKLDPSDPLEALKYVKYITSGGTIKITKIARKGGTPWYRVEARSPDGRGLGYGWVNSIALLGQNLDVVR